MDFVSHSIQETYTRVIHTGDLPNTFKALAGYSIGQNQGIPCVINNVGLP